jgi:predicted nucleic-acid-binding Zn-ribbon protein
MKKTGKCPKCESTDVMKAAALDFNDGVAHTNLTVATYRNPAAFVFTGEQRTILTACVCGQCGFTEFYADSPENLKMP